MQQTIYKQRGNMSFFPYCMLGKTEIQGDPETQRVNNQIGLWTQLGCCC